MCWCLAFAAPSTRGHCAPGLSLLFSVEDGDTGEGMLGFLRQWRARPSRAAGHMALLRRTTVAAFTAPCTNREAGRRVLSFPHCPAVAASTFKVTMSRTHHSMCPPVWTQHLGRHQCSEGRAADMGGFPAGALTVVPSCWYLFVNLNIFKC